MITVEKAIEIIHENIFPLEQKEYIDVLKSYTYVLFEDVYSPINMPPFRQSAMDGYALCLNNSKTYTIVGEVKAGDNYHSELKKGEAVRIFTGAPVPDTANAVIMQEKVTVNHKQIRAENSVTLNDNIRPLGEQVKKGGIALKKGIRITPAAIAYLTSLGITEVCVYKKPSIAIVVTGNELVETGQDLAYGQIYESNAVMLSTALNNLGYQNVSTYKVEDNYENTLDLLGKVITTHDAVLVSGGISVGDYDFVGKALQELSVEQLFYKVKQKPGKPLFFGKKNNKVVFALPGNPAAALSCFYIYVYCALEKMSGNMNFTLAKTKAKSVSSYIKKGDRAQFLKAIYNNGTVEILDGQSSSMLQTFSFANAFVYVSETSESITINDMVEVILLPIN